MNNLLIALREDRIQWQSSDALLLRADVVVLAAEDECSVVLKTRKRNMAG
jgi:hypothetical protein